MWRLCADQINLTTSILTFLSQDRVGYEMSQQLQETFNKVPTEHNTAASRLPLFLYSSMKIHVKHEHKTCVRCIYNCCKICNSPWNLNEQTSTQKYRHCSSYLPVLMCDGRRGLGSLTVRWGERWLCPSCTHRRWYCTDTVAQARQWIHRSLI